MPEALLKTSLCLLSQADASRKIANSKLKLETKTRLWPIYDIGRGRLFYGFAVPRPIKSKHPVIGPRRGCR